MKIAIIGYGKMGKAVERIALSRGHEIVSVIDAGNQEDFDSDAFRSADIAIEFTTPATAVTNYMKVLDRGVKLVSGSTGWTAEMPKVKEKCASTDGTFFWTSNFSIGVNIFFAINRYVAALMNGFPAYTPQMTETHHVHKLDHPSGTAITLAQGIVDECDRITGYDENRCGYDILHIDHIRRAEVPGTHQINWDSEVDAIEITHRAKSRDGFALGAVVAAEWVATQHGFLTMDMLMDKILHNK